MSTSRLSIIIPARNEQANIAITLEPLLADKRHEIIVADGRSTDQTCEIARALGVQVVTADPGRATQLNAGAAAATGDALLFLHADTRLPEDFDRHVLDILSHPGVACGAFRLRIDAPRRSLRVVETLANWRSTALQKPYGDQAIFLTREMFDRIGGFPSLPVMEDFELVRRLRRHGRIEIAPAAVVTSARRWLERGVWRTTLINQLCIAAYYAGVSPQRIAAWRSQPDPSNSAPHLCKP